MNLLAKHILSVSTTAIMVGPLFALEGIGRQIEMGKTLWISGSILMSTLWFTF